VCSTHNVETAARIGADRVVDYTREDATATRERYDLIFDNAGVWPLRTCGRMLADGGSYVMVSSPKSRWLHPLPRLITTPLYFMLASGHGPGFKVAARNTADLELLAGLATRGLLKPVMDRRFTLDEAPEAVRVQGEFHARGKSVVVP
jgi:NADPH:quinone reductase-like Zn-dependent oxidoreductase